jgi:hypothetical protein
MSSKTKIPKKARRVFKGVIFDVYHWPQKMFDNSTVTFEMLKRADTLQVIAITPDKKILLLKEQQPTKKLRPAIHGSRLR